MKNLRTLQVFVHPACPHCRALVDDLRKRGVHFVEIRVNEAEGLGRLQEFCWERRLPVILDHERLSIGFRGLSSSFEELGID